MQDRPKGEQYFFMKVEKMIVFNHGTLNLDKELKLNYPAHWGELWCEKQSKTNTFFL